MHDLATVGAGPAGIATAYLLRHLELDIAILEAAAGVGGRTRSLRVGGVPSCTGALFVYRDTPSEELAAELGIRTAAFTPGTYGIHINNTTVVDSDTHRLIDQVPNLRHRPRPVARIRRVVARGVREVHSGGARSPMRPAAWRV